MGILFCSDFAFWDLKYRITSLSTCKYEARLCVCVCACVCVCVCVFVFVFVFVCLLRCLWLLYLWLWLWLCLSLLCLCAFDRVCASVCACAGSVLGLWVKQKWQRKTNSKVSVIPVLFSDIFWTPFPQPAFKHDSLPLPPPVSNTHTHTRSLFSLSHTPHTRYTPQSTRACGCFVSCFRRKQRSRTRRQKQAIAWKDESAKVGKSPKSNWILYFQQAVTENRPFYRIHGRWLLNAVGEQQRKKALSAFAFLPFLHFLLSLDLSRPLPPPPPFFSLSQPLFSKQLPTPVRQNKQASKPWRR